MINENKDVYTIKLPLLVFSKAKKIKKKKRRETKGHEILQKRSTKILFNISHLQWKKTINAPGLKDEEMAFSVLFHRISVTSEPG